MLFVAAAVALSSGAAAAAPGDRQVREETELYEFEFSYPVEAARYPALVRWFAARRAKARAALIAAVREGQAMGNSGGLPSFPYYSGEGWDKVTETTHFLSLSAGIGAYSGGAHPNHWSDSVLWDKRAGRRRKPLDLFHSPGAFDRALRDQFCTRLDRERAERRGEPVQRGSGLPFDECIAPSALTVLLGSSTGRSFDRIGIIADPYAAGPYVEGDYEFTFPVTAKLLAAVKPEFRDAFAVR